MENLELKEKLKVLEDGSILKKLEEMISNIDSEKAVYDARNVFLKDNVSPYYQLLKKVDNDQKKALGQKLNEIKEKTELIVSSRIETIKQNKLASIKANYDVEIPSDYLQSGYINPIHLVKNQIIKFFKMAGFKIATNSEVTSIEYNFDKLNIKKDHPARSASDTFFIDDKTLLRVHNTAITAKYLELYNNQDEIKVLSYGDVYRKDDDDATHSHQFNQIDFVWAKKGMSLANLKWITDNLLKFLFNKSVKIRCRLSHFPFTEPSFEIDVSCFFCDQKGCNVCKNTKWIEVLGAGLLHPNVIKNANLKPGISAVAFGMGVDRIAMLKYQINDIRRIYCNDFSLLSEFKGGR
ncbi:MAG: phenylalanine--tRNA ligase subunit alpha [Malacoplasma sp.]|nr:phenylalanine--tRNA ligase subunit alpha [Malacoplasma sp.]